MVNRIEVFANKKKVGTLAMSKEKEIIFQYDKDWIETGFSLNPFKLPLTDRIFVSSSPYFHGLFGVFFDSLPDSYGQLLLDRYLKSKGLSIETLNPLDRLTYIGSSGMGILEYVPSLNEIERQIIDFDLIQEECNKLLDSKPVDNLNELYSIGSSAGGSRPKGLIKYKGEDWIVKFNAKFDPKNISEIEYRDMSLAKMCGIEIPEIELLTSKNGNKYFLIKRFDRKGEKKIHMLSVAALLEVDFRAPSLDYNSLIKLTQILTNNEDDVYQMFRRMVFNVLIDNQDDHAKNFAFIYDDERKTYRLSPAYDLLKSNTYYNEHMTSVNGKGKNISKEDMLNVAIKNRLNISRCEKTIEEISAIVASN